MGEKEGGGGEDRGTHEIGASKKEKCASSRSYYTYPGSPPFLPGFCMLYIPQSVIPCLTSTPHLQSW